MKKAKNVFRTLIILFYTLLQIFEVKSQIFHDDITNGILSEIKF